MRSNACPRQEKALVIRFPGGTAIAGGVDLTPDRFPTGQIAQTSVARLSAIVIRHDIDSSVAFFVLADSASAEYLWDCFLDAMNEFAGAVCGADAIRLATRRTTGSDQ